MKSQEIIKILKKHGWVLKRSKGSHHHFVHSDHRGVVTVPHPKRDMPEGTIISIEKQSKIKIRKKK